MARSLRRWMRATGFSPGVLWTFFPTQLVVDLIDRLDADVVVYYCIADFEHLVSHAERISRSELALVARTDVLFVQGESFRQRFRDHSNIHIFPFGVRMAAFETLPAGAPELADVKRPIIGYVGGVHQHVDQTLVERLAQEIDGTVVLIGPEQTDVDRLRKLDRVRFLGQQPHERLPDLIRAFDVGIIPYLRSPYTETVYPTKLNEYLAAGIPVVATALPEVERFNHEFGGVVRVAPDTDAFVNAVRAAAAEHEPAAVARRIDVARRNSWEVRIEKMSALVAPASSTTEDDPAVGRTPAPVVPTKSRTSRGRGRHGGHHLLRVVRDAVRLVGRRPAARRAASRNGRSSSSRAVSVNRGKPAAAIRSASNMPSSCTATATRRSWLSSATSSRSPRPS